MKKSLIWILAVLAPMAFVGCGGSEPADAPAPATETTTAGDKVENLMKDAADALSESAEDAGDAVDSAIERTREAGADAGEATREALDDAQEAVKSAAERAGERADELMEEASQVVSGDDGDRHEKLIGTNWQVGDFRMEFQSEEVVKISGGALTSLAPSGLEAEYTYADGVIVLNAMGQTREGTWDGETLIIDGNQGVLLPES